MFEAIHVFLNNVAAYWIFVPGRGFAAVYTVEMLISALIVGIAIGMIAVLAVNQVRKYRSKQNAVRSERDNLKKEVQRLEHESYMRKIPTI